MFAPLVAATLGITAGADATRPHHQEALDAKGLIGASSTDELDERLLA